jgi:hypothetical protein
MSTITSLEQLHQDWRAESLAAWKLHESVQRSSSNPLQQAIQVNATRRMLREARIISILGLLIGAWKTHLTGGLALLSSGPGLYSDLRILRECRSITAEDQTIEVILEASKITPSSLGGVWNIFGPPPDVDQHRGHYCRWCFRRIQFGRGTCIRQYFSARTCRKCRTTTEKTRICTA